MAIVKAAEFINLVIKYVHLFIHISEKSIKNPLLLVKVNQEHRRNHCLRKNVERYVWDLDGQELTLYNDALNTFFQINTNVFNTINCIAKSRTIEEILWDLDIQLRSCVYICLREVH